MEQFAAGFTRAVGEKDWQQIEQVVVVLRRIEDVALVRSFVQCISHWPDGALLSRSNKPGTID